MTYPNNRPRPCAVCGMDTTEKGEIYMINDALWQRAYNIYLVEYPEADSIEPDFLCIDCIEDLLERRLDPHDFTFCPLNRDIELYRSRLLISRMTRFQGEYGMPESHVYLVPLDDHSDLPN